MSGHSKWSTIKHKKEKQDAQRGKMFTKLIREITTAAREGGGDESANSRLRTAILAAKAANMPQVNIEKAVKKGTGELPGVVYEEKTYEGYGPGGVAILVETLTDNTNRTTSEVRHLLSKYGGNLGETGCVSWMFETRGLITVDKQTIDEEKLMEISIEAGAVDMSGEDEVYEIITTTEGFANVKEILAEKGVDILSDEITKIPKSNVHVEGKQAGQVLKLVEALEDSDDVQQVYANFDMDIE
ncbi:MAG TPA: YebC/PmpR family DNA-binding transcriptional regulator [bacterium]|nr:YebC/PmpR family DNA-binding transcriptional regulator [bacterium]